MKFILTLKNSFPAGLTSCELEGDEILCNDVSLPREIDPDVSSFATSKAYVIGHEFGAICMVWADNEQDALDNAVDLNMLDCLMDESVSPCEVENEGLTRLGNAGEPFDLTYVWLAEVDFKAERDIHLIVKLVRACEAGLDNVDAWR